MSFTVRAVESEKKPGFLRTAVTVWLPLATSVLRFYKHLEWSREEQNEERKKERRLKRTITMLLAGLIVILLLIGTLKTIVRLKAMAFGMVSMIGANVPADENGYTNVLLLGEGDSDHDGVDLTDTIMVASLDPSETRSAVLLSIPRDTFVLETDKMGKGRINSLYRDYRSSLMRKGMKKDEASRESLKQLGTEVGVLLGLPIHGTIKVNFSGFVEAVDLLGGLDVVVPYDLVDPKYPGPNYSYETFSIAAGPQHLDGATALKYARSRHTTSDFSRSARQQQIIAAAGKKVQDLGIISSAGKISAMLEVLSKNTESTFGTRELLGLANLGRSIEHQNVISAQLNDQNGLYDTGVEQGGFLYSPPREQFDNAAVLLPVSIPETPITWKQIQAFGELLFRKRSVFLSPTSIVVLNASAKEGMARRLGGELYRYTFNVVASRNLGPRGTPDAEISFIAVNPALSGDGADASKRRQAQETARLLSDLLKFPVKESADSLAFSKEGADIAIIVGKDYRFSILQDLIVVR